MEWVLLLLVVPAIVLPVILLFAFTGCDFDPSGVVLDEPPPTPIITLATPEDETRIRLEWTNLATETVTFALERTPPFDPAQIPDNPQSGFVDTGLEEGETYSYRLRAVSDAGGSSELSEAATATTWTRTFDANQNAGQNEDATGDCIVQRLDPPSLTRPGNLIRVAVSAGSASAGTSLTITRVTFSKPAAAGDPFDSAQPMATIDGNFTVNAGESRTTAAVSFEVDPLQPLLVAFDVNAPGGTRSTALTGATAFIKDGSAQNPATDAAIADRSGFTPRADRVWLITRLDAATEFRA